MSFRKEGLLRKLKDGGRAIGTSVSCSDSQISEALAHSGFDLIWIDMEHTAMSRRDVLCHITAIQGAGVPAFVRVPWNDAVLVKPLLDMGPDGIIFPMVSTAEEAAKAAASLDYPPAGVRSYGPLRADVYGGDSGYASCARGDLLCFVQIESSAGVRNIDGICSVDGVDGVLLGGMDLSASLGALGCTESEQFRSAVSAVAAAAARAGKPAGCCTPDCEETLRMYAGKGISIFLISGDIAMVTRYARDMIPRVHGSMLPQLTDGGSRQA